MFKLARRFIKTGFIFLITGLITGLYILITSHFKQSWFEYSLITVHAHLILFGFVMSLIIGVAIWMFPRTKDRGEYSPVIAETVYWLLTLGTSVRAVCEVVMIFRASAVLSFLIVIAGVAQLFSGVLFVYNIWSRVKPVGRLK